MNILSVSGKKWILKKYNEEESSYIKENFFLDEIVSKLISIRNINRADIKSFLDPLIKNYLPNPEILTDMKKASLRTLTTIANKEKIGIFGDYDVDGASSTALLGNFFSYLKIPYEIYIPDRRKEGYGPSINAFKKLIDNGVQLIFTVDCGTLSFDAIKYASQKNIDVIVLDHHQSEVKLPDAYSVINPNRIDDKSNLNYLCAAGVTFIFLVSLNKELRSNNWFIEKNINEPNLINCLDLVSLGTICDVVPLVGLNRAIVKQGLKILKLKKNLGLKTLLDLCDINTSPKVYHLGFHLGPRINAGGRVGKSSHGANLLLSSNPKDAFKLASELDIFNKQRQILENEVYTKILNTLKIYSSDPSIIIIGENWHEGVIGIVASKLKDKFNKLVIIIAVEGEIGKASARSVSGIDIGSLIISATQEKILIKGGGHKMAGGFSIKTSNIEKFKSFVNTKIKKNNEDFKEAKKLYLDSVIAPSAINLEFYNKVDALAPFGSGNPEPRFIIEDLKSVNHKIIKEKHIKSILKGKDGSTIKCIAFNSLDSEIGAYLLNKNNKLFNIAGKLSLNEWKGESNVEFIIDDISVNKANKNEVPSSIG